MAENGLDLDRKLGPFPLGVWLIVVGGGLGLAYFINRGQSTADEQLLAEPGVGTGLVPAGAVIQPPPTDESGAVEDETNVGWGRKVTNWLIAQGHDAALSDNAVRKYLAGESLNLQEQSLLNLALAVHGAPPEALPPTETPTIEPKGAPTLDTDQSGTRNVRRGEIITIRGTAKYGSQPASGELIRFRSFSERGRVTRAWFALTDSEGNWKTSLGGWGSSRGTRRRYDISWKGTHLIRYVRIS